MSQLPGLIIDLRRLRREIQVIENSLTQEEPLLKFPGRLFLNWSFQVNLFIYLKYMINLRYFNKCDFHRQFANLPVDLGLFQMDYDYSNDLIY